MSRRVVSIGEIASQDRVIVPSESMEATSRPYLGLEQIASGTGYILSYETTSTEGKSTTFAFDDSHVLYGKLRPYLNKVAVPDRLGRCSTEIIPLKPRGVNRDYLAMLLRSEQVVNAAMSDKTGSRMPRADMDLLLDLEVSIHRSSEEQGQIATRLKAQLAEVEAARQAAEMQLRDVRLLRNRILKDIFSELGSAPKKKLGDFARTTSGSTPSRGSKQYWQPAEIPWVKTGEVAFAPIASTQEAISKTALAECSLTLLPPKTILIAMYGQGKTRGQSAILEIAATTNQACFAILPNETWEPDFLFLWLKSSYQDLRDLSENRGGNQANLNGGLLNALEVPAPSRNIQLKIVKRINAALTELDAMEISSVVALQDIRRLPSRILAQAFESLGDEHD